MKRNYNQPEVTVASIALQSNLLAGSPATPTVPVNPGVDTDDQW